MSIMENFKQCSEDCDEWILNEKEACVWCLRSKRIDTLESRLEEYRKLLKRAYKLLEIAAEFYERNDENATGEHLWLSDYAALTKGAKE